MRPWIKILILMFSLGCAYMLLTWWGLQKHDARIHRVATFLQLGKRVSQQMRETHEIPQSIEGLRAVGWLQDSDWQFITQNAIIYVAPRTNASDETVILRMPYEPHAEHHTVFAIHLNGHMDKERPSNSGTK